MITRRKWLGAVMFGWLTSSCASNGGSPRPSLALVLQSLPSIGTGTAFVAKFGEPYSRERLKPLDVKVKDSWKNVDVSSSPDLIDSLPIGAQTLLYYFRYINSAVNPTGGGLQVLIDENDHIVGWTYSRSLLGYEKDAHFLRNAKSP